MLNLDVVIQGPCQQVRVALMSEYLLAEHFPVGVPLPIRPESVGLIRGAIKRAAIITSHARYIGHIGAEVQAVRQLRHYVKILLTKLTQGSNS